jgi:hypothetical protein
VSLVCISGTEQSPNPTKSTFVSVAKQLNKQKKKKKKKKKKEEIQSKEISHTIVAVAASPAGVNLKFQFQFQFRDRQHQIVNRRYLSSLEPYNAPFAIAAPAVDSVTNGMGTSEIWPIN